MPSSEELFAFVLMPFDKSFDDLYKYGIKEPAERLGIIAQRVDEQIYGENMLERIYNQIESADIIIADMTGHNPNVFYEVGYSHGRGKICILTTKVSQDIPFDLKHRRHIVHHGSIEGLSSRMEEELSWAKKEILSIRKSHVNVILRSASGSLSTTKYQSIGIMDFRIDLVNDSDKDSAEIESAYIYSGDGWSLEHDSKQCPSKASDISPFSLMHFIPVPVRRLQKNGTWAQIRFSAKKILATAFKGEALKKEYKIEGRLILRLLTSAEKMDHEMSIKVILEDLPF